jgi:DNA-binding FrmR family transcriptional regulator
MAHISGDPDKEILARVRRIRCQMEEVERAIEGIGREVEEGTDCHAILQQTDAARGALNGPDG